MQVQRRAKFRAPKGFTLIELLVVIAIIALLISILLPSLSKARCAARDVIDQVNRKSMGTATHTYATDFQDNIFGFTWGVVTTTGAPGGPFLRAVQSGWNANDPNQAGLQVGPGDDALTAAAKQATWIMRVRGGRGTDLVVPSLWIPHILYTHLVLQDFIDQRLPAQMVVSPHDRYRLQWQDYRGFQTNTYAPFQPDASDPEQWRWPYSSSYQTVPAAFSPDTMRAPGGPQTIRQGPFHYNYVTTGVRPDSLGKRKLTDVRFPSQKVQNYDSNARGCKNRVATFYNYPGATQYLLMFDQSVNVRSISDALPGFNPGTYNPNNPGFWTPTMMNYDPNGRAWEPPDYAGADQPGFFQWTTGGIKGIDFVGGPATWANFAAARAFEVRGPF